MKKNSFVFALLLFAMVVVSGGCGGGGGGDSSQPSHEKPYYDEPIENPVVSDDPVVEPENPVDEPNEPIQDEPTDMLDAQYWIARLRDPDLVLLESSDIEQINKEILSNGDVNQRCKPESIIGLPDVVFYPFGTSLVIDGNTYSTNEVDDLIALFEENCDRFRALRYGITVTRAHVRYWPTSRIVCSVANEYEDLMELSTVEMNSPFVIAASCKVDGKIYYYGIGEYARGWIVEDEIAICSSKPEWEVAWKVVYGNTNFVVIAEDGVDIELSDRANTKVQANMGTVLKTTGNSSSGTYVYVPTRDEDGAYVQKMGFISSNYEVSVGFLPFTQENLIRVAFKKVGTEIGLNNQKNGISSVVLLRQIYSCFGIFMPDNVWDHMALSHCQSVEYGTPMNERKEILDGLSEGSTIYNESTGIIYLGNVDGLAYAIWGCDNVYSLQGNTKHVGEVVLTTLDEVAGLDGTWESSFLGYWDISIF